MTKPRLRELAIKLANDLYKERIDHLDTISHELCRREDIKRNEDERKAVEEA